MYAIEVPQELDAELAGKTQELRRTAFPEIG
jgi:hypothetical protein